MVSLHTKQFDAYETKWLTDLLTETARVQRDISIEHWGDSEFNSHMSQSSFLGISNYFFGELELSNEWFKAQVNKQLENVGNKFIPSLHVETDPDKQIQCFLKEDEFRISFDRDSIELENYLQQFNIAVENLKIEEDKEISQWIETKQKLLFLSEKMTSNFKEIHLVFKELKLNISENRFGRIAHIDLRSIEEELANNIMMYDQEIKNFKIERSNKEQAKTIKHSIEQASYAPLNLSNEIYAILRKTRGSSEKLVQTQMTLIGDASIGKTHVACWTCFRRINQGLPAILLLGKHFHTGTSLEKQILERLDIPESYSWNDFTQALAIAANVYKTKIPIVIDALDEALQMSIWRNELPGLVCSITNQSNIGIIVTCRSSYRTEIWPSAPPLTLLKHTGSALARLRMR